MLALLTDRDQTIRAKQMQYIEDSKDSLLLQDQGSERSGSRRAQSHPYVVGRDAPVKPFPTVDLSRADAKLVDAVCRDTGFLAIVGHGFPEDVLESTWSAARAFFERPHAAKMGVAMPYAGYPYGYAPFREEALALSLGDSTPPDLKETFSIGPEATWSGGKHATLWPEEPTELEAVFRRYFRQMGRLAARVMALFATALELPADFFASKINRHASALRILNYPALEAKPPVIRLLESTNDERPSRLLE